MANFLPFALFGARSSINVSSMAPVRLEAVGTMPALAGPHISETIFSRDIYWHITIVDPVHVFFLFDMA